MLSTDNDRTESCEGHVLDLSVLGGTVKISHADLETAGEVWLDFILFEISCEFTESVETFLTIRCVLLRCSCNFDLILKGLKKSRHNLCVLIKEVRNNIL